LLCPPPLPTRRSSDLRSLAARRGDLGNIRIDTFGGHSLHAFETGAGTLDLLVWGAAQTGRWGVQQQRAGAVDIEGGIQPKILAKDRKSTRLNSSHQII